VKKPDIPEFAGWKEEAEYWDKTDASFMLEEEGEWVGPGVVRAAPDLCRRCGAQMELRRLDVTIAHGRLWLHEVKFYVCPHCGARNLPLNRQELFVLKAVAIETVEPVKEPVAA